MNNISQSKEFIYFCLIGGILSFIFDIFRSTRKNFKTPDFITYIEDILFLIISASIIMYGILKISNGILRFYMFLGIFLGITIYSLTFSKFCIIIISGVMMFLKRIFDFIKKLFVKIIFLFKKLGKKLHL